MSAAPEPCFRFLLKKSSLTVNPKKPPVDAFVAQVFSGVADAAIAAKPPDSFDFVRKSGTTICWFESCLSSSLTASAKLNVLLVFILKMLAAGADVSSGLELLFSCPVDPKIG